MAGVDVVDVPQGGEDVCSGLLPKKPGRPERCGAQRSPAWPGGDGGGERGLAESHSEL